MKTLIRISVVALTTAAFGCGSQPGPTAPELPKIATVAPGSQESAPTECDRVIQLYSTRIAALQQAIGEVDEHAGTVAAEHLLQKLADLKQEAAEAITAACQ